MRDFYVDISDEQFRSIQEHEETVLTLADPSLVPSVGEGDVLKLYHPSDPSEALRVLVKKAETGDSLRLDIELMEWMFQIETELDEQLEEEKKWLEGLI